MESRRDALVDALVHGVLRLADDYRCFATLCSPSARLTLAQGWRFAKSGRGLAIDRALVEAHAARLVSVPELLRAGWGIAQVRRATIERSVPVLEGGWCREAATRARILPSGAIPVDFGTGRAGPARGRRRRRRR